MKPSVPASEDVLISPAPADGLWHGVAALSHPVNAKLTVSVFAPVYSPWVDPAVQVTFVLPTVSSVVTPMVPVNLRLGPGPTDHSNLPGWRLSTASVTQLELEYLPL